jgi:hypothetical protein
MDDLRRTKAGPGGYHSKEAAIAIQLVGFNPDSDIKALKR